MKKLDYYELIEFITKSTLADQIIFFIIYILPVLIPIFIALFIIPSGNKYLLIRFIFITIGACIYAFSFAISIIKLEMKRAILSFFIVITILIGSYGYFYKIENGIEGTMMNENIDPYYFSMVTWTTLGYGDLMPSNYEIRIVACNQAFIGYIFIILMYNSFHKNTDVDLVENIDKFKAEDK